VLAVVLPMSSAWRTSLGSPTLVVPALVPLRLSLPEDERSEPPLPDPLRPDELWLAVEAVAPPFWPAWEVAVAVSEDRLTVEAGTVDASAMTRKKRCFTLRILPVAR